MIERKTGVVVEVPVSDQALFDLLELADYEMLDAVALEDAGMTASYLAAMRPVAERLAEETDRVINNWGMLEHYNDEVRQTTANALLRDVRDYVWHLQHGNVADTVEDGETLDPMLRADPALSAVRKEMLTTLNWQAAAAFRLLSTREAAYYKEDVALSQVREMWAEHRAKPWGYADRTWTATPGEVLEMASDEVLAARSPVRVVIHPDVVLALDAPEPGEDPVPIVIESFEHKPWARTASDDDAVSQRRQTQYDQIQRIEDEALAAYERGDFEHAENLDAEYEGLVELLDDSDYESETQYDIDPNEEMLYTLSALWDSYMNQRPWSGRILSREEAIETAKMNISSLFHVPMEQLEDAAVVDAMIDAYGRRKDLRQRTATTFQLKIPVANLWKLNRWGHPLRPDRLQYQREHSAEMPPLEVELLTSRDKKSPDWVHVDDPQVGDDDDSWAHDPRDLDTRHPSYSLQDGHHRLTVLREKGEEFVDAIVRVPEVPHYIKDPTIRAQYEEEIRDGLAKLQALTAKTANASELVFETEHDPWALAKQVNIHIDSAKDFKAGFETNGQLVAALFTSYDKECYAFDIVVAPDQQGSGLGSKLMDLAIADYEELREPFPDMRFCLDAVNPQAVSMLQSRGFEVERTLGDHTYLTRQGQRTVSRDEVLAALEVAEQTGKQHAHWEQQMKQWRGSLPDEDFVLVDVPVAALDIAGYSEERAQSYAEREGELPPILAYYNERAGRISKDTLYVPNGNHRARAAEIRGESTIAAFVPASHWDRWTKSETARTASDDPPVRRLMWRGMPVAIEVEPGGVRYPGGEYETFIPSEWAGGYGYFEGILAEDGDSLDVIWGPDESADGPVFVAAQSTPDGTFAQFKCILGFEDSASAEAGFKMLWPESMFISITEVPQDIFETAVLPKLEVVDIEAAGEPENADAAPRTAAVEQADVAVWADEVKTRLGLQVFDVYLRSDGSLKLDTLIVPKAARKQGLGTVAMEELNAFADAHGLRVVLSPAVKDDFHGTTSRSRLVRFYKDLGYAENKGRKKDFTISEGMYREPTPKKEGQATKENAGPLPPGFNGFDAEDLFGPQDDAPSTANPPLQVGDKLRVDGKGPVWIVEKEHGASGYVRREDAKRKWFGYSHDRDSHRILIYPVMQGSGDRTGPDIADGKPVLQAKPVESGVSV